MPWVQGCPPSSGSWFTDPRWEQWATGVRVGSVDHPSSSPSRAEREPRGRTLVFQDAGLVGVAARSGWIGALDTVLVGSDTGVPGWLEQPYGMAGWSADPPEPPSNGLPAVSGAEGDRRPGHDGRAPGSGPGIVLRVGDDHDLSAFLRDADRAMDTGCFAGHLLRPDTLVGDLSSLGDDFTAAGPDHRLWVAADGRVSTSQSGADLGRIEESPATVTARWRARNDGGTRPCAVGLAKVLDEGERTEALADRPWLARYHATVRAMRRLRARGLLPIAASGFGRRLDRRVAAAQPGPVVDDATAPLLLVTRQQGRNRYWVADPVTTRGCGIDAADALRLEYLLAFRSRPGAGMVDPAPGGRSPRVALDDLIDRLVDDDICAQWFAALEQGARPLPVGRPVFG